MPSLSPRFEAFQAINVFEAELSTEVRAETSALLAALDVVEVDSITNTDGIVNLKPIYEWQKNEPSPNKGEAMDFVVTKLEEIINKPDQTAADFETYNRSLLRLNLINTFNSLTQVRFAATHF